MARNPYKFNEPLDPMKDRAVLIPRQEQIDYFIERIIAGEYWVITGPRKTGKTTLLRQIRHTFENKALFLYVGLEQCKHMKENDFYRHLIDRFIAEIPFSMDKAANKRFKAACTDTDFIEFLVDFKPQTPSKRIILLIDDIESLPFQRSFLLLWRSIFHVRFNRKELNKYTAVVTCAADPIAITTGSGSPFNMAEKYAIKDFSPYESKQLICAPLESMNIKIEPGAIEKLLDWTSGHPQMLQHLCFLLVENVCPSTKTITERDVDNAIPKFFADNSCLGDLKNDIANDSKLRKLTVDMLKGKQISYLPYEEFSYSGTGPVIEKDSICAPRNKIFEAYFKSIHGLKNIHTDTVKEETRRND
jgi:hypothetical protein